MRKKLFAPMHKQQLLESLFKSKETSAMETVHIYTES